MLASTGLERSCDAKIGYPGMPVSKKDILGFDVTVDDAMRVGVREGVRDLAADPESLLYRELRLSSESVPETFPLDVGHGIPQQAGRLSRGEYRQDVGVVEPRGYPDLEEEALRANGRGQLGV
jgi:hypothetical protein